jgi:hypothetical protein
MVWTSFNIGAGGATELSVCDYFAEPEMSSAEGEGVIPSERVFNLKCLILFG